MKPTSLLNLTQFTNENAPVDCRVDLIQSDPSEFAETLQVGQQGDDDNQRWSWIHHCDEVISKLPIGLA